MPPYLPARCCHWASPAFLWWVRSDGCPISRGAGGGVPGALQIYTLSTCHNKQHMYCWFYWGHWKFVIINTRILALIFTSFRFVAQLTLIGKTFQLQTSSFKTKDQTFFENQKSWEILWNTRYHTLRNITNRFTTYLQQLSALWLRIKVLALCTL